MNEQTLRWYMVNKDGMATLCEDQADAEKEAKDAQEVWPHMGPHRAVQLVEVSQAFTSADMATAAAQGFRDGQSAQIAVAAGWQDIATAPKDGTPLLLRSKKGRVADGLWLAATSSHGGWAWAYVNQEPTHWMPLPPHPSSAKGVAHGPE